MHTIFIPEGTGPTDPGKRALLDQLVGADLATLSPREQAVLDRASDHGECYWATIEDRPQDDDVIVISDMGDPSSRVILRAPRGTPNRRLLEALDAAIQVLLRVD